MSSSVRVIKIGGSLFDLPNLADRFSERHSRALVESVDRAACVALRAAVG